MGGNRHRWRRLAAIAVICGLVGTVMIPMSPVNRMVLRLAFLGCLAGVWGGCVVLAWKRAWPRAFALGLPVLRGFGCGGI